MEELGLQFAAIDGISAIADQIGAKIEGLAKSVFGHLDGIGGAFGSMAAKAGEALAVVGVATAGAMVAIGVSSVNAAGQFQAAMELIRTQAGASQQEVDSMSAAVLQLAGEVATAPDELAKGLYHLESAGFRGQQALDALRIAAEGAKVGQANLEDVTNALNAVLVAGVPEANNMTAAMGELNAIVGAGDMRMQDLADAMGTGILASAKVFGVGLQDVGAALAVFGDNNIRGSDAATKLRMGLTMMAAPSGAAAKELESIGLQSTTLADAMRGPGGLVSALEILQQHLDASGESASEQANTLSKIFGGGKTAAGVEILLTQLDRLKTKEAEVGAGAGKFADEWAITQQNFSTKTDKLKASLDRASISLGEKLLPYAGQLVDKLTPLIPIIATVANNFLDAWTGAAQFGGELPAGVRLAQDLHGALDKLVQTFKDMKPEFDAMLDGLKWIRDNGSTVKGVAEGFVAAWVVFKGIQFANTFALLIGSLKAVSVEEGRAVAGARLIGIESEVNAVKAAAAWTASAIKSSAAWTASKGETLAIYALYAAEAIQNAAKVTLAWVTSAGKSLAAWVATKSAMVTLSAQMSLAAIGDAAKAALAWVVSAAKAAAAWVASAAEIVAIWLMLQIDAIGKAATAALAWTVGAAVAAAGWVASGVAMIAEWAAMAVASVASATVAGVAWLIALGPILLLIAAVVVLVGLIVILTTNVGGLRDKMAKLGDVNLAGFFKSINDGIVGFIRNIQDAISWLGNLESTIANLKLPGGVTLGDVVGVVRYGFAEGGVVPGPEGAPQLAVVHGGERVLTPNQQRMVGFGGESSRSAPAAQQNFQIVTQVALDSRVIQREVAKGIPRELRRMLPA